MKKENRLAHSEQFARVRRYGQSWSHPLLILRALRNDLPHNRFGFLVGKRIGKAVVRNRVRRRMREAVRARAACIAQGWDIVLVAREPSAQADLWQVMEALDSLLLRAGLTAKEDPVAEADA